MFSQRAILAVNNSLNSNSTMIVCDDVHHCRTLPSIVFSCTSIIFLCTWVALHPNAPKDPYESWSSFWKRVGLMLGALVAPEAILAWAFWDWVASSDLLVEIMKDHPGCDWTETHAQLLNMGGFRVIDQHGIPARLENAEIPASHVHILEICADEIDDRSKSDFIAKAIIVLQTLWFILQMANRAHQGLTITELEFTTLAHTILNIFVYAFWWNKPVNIRFPFDVYPIKKKDWNPGVKRRAMEETERFLVAGSGKRRSSGRQLSRRIRLGKYVGGVLERGAEDLSWWDIGLTMCVALVGGTFGAIHCFAWNASFPTHIEAKLWRASAIVVTVAPSSALLLALMFGGIRYMWSVRVSGDYVLFQSIVIAVIYAVARICLLVLAFLALRALPYGALLTPSWTVYLPHIS